MRPAHVTAVLLCVLAQGALTGQWLPALALGVACGAGWALPMLRHAIGSFALGGLGMAVGGWTDSLLGLAASCHDAGFWSLSTAGMVVGCTAACVFVCRVGGASGLNPMFHAITLVGMFTGEQVLVVGLELTGVVPGHWTLTLGMAVGSAVGAFIAGLARPSWRRWLGSG